MVIYIGEYDKTVLPIVHPTKRNQESKQRNGLGRYKTASLSASQLNEMQDINTSPFPGHLTYFQRRHPFHQARDHLTVMKNCREQY